MLPVLSKHARILTIGAAFVSLFLLFTLSNSSAASSYSPRISVRAKSIPNIVHYTYLKKDEHSELNFRFEHFLALYSSVIFFKPTAIYIHIDFNETTLEHAREYGSKWTKKVLLTFPKLVKIKHVKPPSHVNGRPVVNVEHRSDFLRFAALYKYGGIYMDWDVLPLRDITPLRESGFNNIVGRELLDAVNNGILMSKPGSALAYIMDRDAYSTFSGEWTEHSVKLLTKVAERLAMSPREVLILDRQTWSPTSWEPKSMEYLYSPHNEVPVDLEIQVNDPTLDPILRWDNKMRNRNWEMDFSQSYLMHAFHNRISPPKGFTGISVPYVLARDSNYALAAWPAVKHMLDHGVVSELDVD